MAKSCFIISSIGEKESEIREIADEKFDLVFEPVLKDAGFEEVTRADKIGTPGSISYDIVNHIINSELVIADVSDLNPNVFYELAIRNAIQKPVIVIKSEGQKMPFDIYDKRAISLDMNTARQWTEAKEELKKQIENVNENPELASKSILSDFTGFQINATNEKKTDTNLELKDLKSEIRRIYDEVRKPRIGGIGGSGGGGGVMSKETLYRVRRKRADVILSMIKEKFGEGQIFKNKQELLSEINKQFPTRKRFSEKYVQMLFDDSKIIESEDGIFPVVY